MKFLRNFFRALLTGQTASATSEQPKEDKTQSIRQFAAATSEQPKEDKTQSIRQFASATSEQPKEDKTQSMQMPEQQRKAS